MLKYINLLFFSLLCCSISLSQAPTADFSADPLSACTGELIDFTNTSSTNGGAEIQDYVWDFGDGNTSNDESTSHSYSLPGTYTVTLVITNTAGEADAEVKPNYITILPSPDVSFTPLGLGCTVPLTLSIQNNSDSGSEYSYEWDFGNGNTYTGCENVFNVYEEGGSYSIALTAYDDNGCFNDVTYNDFITVYQTPTAAMNVDPIYLYPDVPTTNITNESVGGDTFVWNMGDTPIDFMGFEPGAYTYSPNVADTIYVSLLAVTDEGCTDSTQGFVAILNDPFLYAPNSFTPDGNNSNDVWIPVFSSPEYVQPVSYTHLRAHET